MKHVSGMGRFTILWIGQIVSLIGTSVTNFAFTIWAYELTGQATTLALIGLFFFTPQIITGLFAGAIVDRMNRKTALVVSDLASGLATSVILVLFATGNLEIWHLYVNAVIAGTFQNFQWIAYAASITLVVPKESYARANGLVSVAETGSGLMAPAIAGAVYGVVGLSGILAFDVVTFVFAITAVLLIHIPQTEKNEAETEGQGSIWQESLFGIRYIWERGSLLGLQTIFLIGNFLASVPIAIVSAMMLARTDNDEFVLGIFQTAGALGGILGGLVMSSWGGTRKKIHTLLWGWMASGVFDLAMLGIVRTVPLWIFSRFLGGFTIPFMNSTNQAIWQLKVPPNIQGRVFGVRRFLALCTLPIAYAIAGPISDDWLEPAMSGDGYLVPYFSWLVGSGPGSGMALIFVVCGLLTVVLGVAGYFIPSIRYVEDILPDHGLEGEGYSDKERSI